MGRKLIRLGLENVLVLALPRGGVVVGYEVARILRSSLDVLVVRKIGVPWQSELAVGAVAEGNNLYLDKEMVDKIGLTEMKLKSLTKGARYQVSRQVKLFRSGRSLPDLTGRAVVLVDDGLATGATAIAAARAVKKHHPVSLIFAAPVCAAESLVHLEPEVDRIVYLTNPSNLAAIGSYYADFSQVSDDEVRRLLV